MKNQEDRKAIETVLADYAQVLSTAKKEDICEFFSKEGMLMPDGSTLVLRPGQLLSIGESFFAQNDFSIGFDVVDVTFDGVYAFVLASANTTRKNRVVSSPVNTTSKDFFVFKKEDADWKIYRYMFNKAA